MVGLRLAQGISAKSGHRAAYQLLREHARSTNRKLVDAAAGVVDSRALKRLLAWRRRALSLLA
jgi:hypothetical protein